MGKMNQERNEDRREYRRKRRIRNQIIAYAVLVLLLAGVGYGGYKGVLYLTQRFATPEETESVSVNEPVVSENEPGIIATPEDVLDVISENEAEEEEVPEVSPEETAALEYISGMTLEQKVASLFIVTPESITGVGTAIQAGEGTRSALSEYAVGGIVYAGRNITGSEQFAEMTANTQTMYQELYGVPVWLVVQEEGATNVIAGSAAGVVAQAAAGEIGTSGDTGNAYQSYTTIAGYLGDYGIGVNLGPVCDVATNAEGYIGDRSFSSDADIAASMVRQAVDAQVEQGIITCLTAFPGQGEATTNPINGTATTSRTVEEMYTCEFLPFQAGIEEGAQMVMMSHIVVEGQELPSSLNAYLTTDVLRGELGFEGVIITDYMDKAAITAQYDSGEAAVLAILAGADMILRPEDFETAYQAILDAVAEGTITEERIDESLMRIYTLKFAE